MFVCSERFAVGTMTDKITINILYICFNEYIDSTWLHWFFKSCIVSIMDSQVVEPMAMLKLLSYVVSCWQMQWLCVALQPSFWRTLTGSCHESGLFSLVASLICDLDAVHSTLCGWTQMCGAPWSQIHVSAITILLVQGLKVLRALHCFLPGPSLVTTPSTWCLESIYSSASSDIQSSPRPILKAKTTPASKSFRDI